MSKDSLAQAVNDAFNRVPKIGEDPNIVQVFGRIAEALERIAAALEGQD